MAEELTPAPESGESTPTSNQAHLPGEVVLSELTAAALDYKPLTVTRLNDNTLKMTLQHSDPTFRPYPRFELTFPVFGRQELGVIVAVFLPRFVAAYQTYCMRRPAIIAAKHYDAGIQSQVKAEFPERPAIARDFAANYPDWEEDVPPHD